MKNKPNYYKTLYTSIYGKKKENMECPKYKIPKRTKRCPMGFWMLNLYFIVHGYGCLIVGIIFPVATIPCAIFGVTFYLISLWESIFIAKERRILKDLSKCGNKNANEEYEYFKKIGLVTTWQMQCYHYENEWIMEEYRNSDGYTMHREVFKYVKKKTHYASRVIEFQHWTDSSPQLYQPFTGIVDPSLIVFRSFPDYQLRDRYERVRQLFIQQNNKDDHFDFIEKDRLAGGREPTLTTNNGPINFLTYTTYIIISIFTFGWLIRWYILTHVAKDNYLMIKIIHQSGNEFF